MLKPIPQDHFTFISSEEVRNICKPLFSNTDIIFFHHVRSYSDHDHFALTSCPEFLLFLYNNKVPRPDRDGHGNALLANGWYLAEELEGGVLSKEVTDSLRANLNLDHFMLKVDHQEKFSDLFIFAAKPESLYVKNFYLNNIDLLERFLRYFKLKAASLYEASEDIYNHIVIRFENQANSVAPSVMDQQKRHDFIQQLVDTSNIIKDGKEVQLTHREKECLMHLSKGKSIKEAAAILGLSPRTVSVHFKNIKDKLNCYSKSAIIELFRSQAFYDEEL